jgi:glycosyltransferase involved in cell wall biosynthesis
VVIPNGVPLPDPRPDLRVEVRAEWEVPDGALVIGRAARYHRMKDYPTFIAAASLLAHRAVEVVFVACGEGVDQGNRQLWNSITEAGLADRFRLLGRVEEMERFYAGIDLFCSASMGGEGFPNVVAEAMAAGVPAVVTDVGDSALIVGDTGVVVPSRDQQALADALAGVVEAGPQALSANGRLARERVEGHFGLHAMVAAYTRLYEELAVDVRHRRSD